jgi:hypothetical protein
MTRPVYETALNKSAEDEVADQIAKAWDIQLVKLKPLYRFDRAFIFENEITGYCEIKCRTNKSTDYPTYLLSMDKYTAATALNQLMEKSVYLVVAWTDITGWVKLVYNPEWRVKMGGRMDRNDEQDMEPCVFIPVKDFKALTVI